MTNRPTFLQQNHTNGNTIVEAFKKLSLKEAGEVDSWLLQASQYGSVTWQEIALYNWINEYEDLDEAFAS